MDDDAALMKKVAGGDKAAFAALFDRHQAGVVRFASRFVGSTARAEEIAQDVFLKLYRSADGYQPTAKFKTYLFRITTNHCLNALRRVEARAEVDLRRPDPEEERPLPEPIDAADPSRSHDAVELQAAVNVALTGMSDRERAAFAMCRFEGMAYRDIAAALGATEAAVKSLIHRASLQVLARLDAVSAFPAGAPS